MRLSCVGHRRPHKFLGQDTVIVIVPNPSSSFNCAFADIMRVMESLDV